MAPKTDPWVRLFDVSDPVKHKKGYTIYKVTSTVYPRASPEAQTQVVVWKRYNDFKKLHKSLQVVHTKLYLKGTFPPFARSRLFGRFDESVIEERRQSGLALLEFVAQHPPLFTSQLFVKFFESGQKMSPQTNFAQQETMTGDVPPPLEPLSRLTDEPNLCLGGVWQYPQEQESISLSSESDDRTTTDGESVVSLASTVELFDPLVNKDEMNKYINNNVWLLSTKIDESNELNESLSPIICTENDEQCDYIVSAAAAVSLAQQNEADANYEMAFSFYKRSVEMLLKGATHDANEIRRDAVRKKTCQYLTRAEEIYRKYLIGQDHSIGHALSPSVHSRSAVVGLLQCALGELKNYKVIGLIDKVILVLDIITHNTFVIKILHKTACANETGVTSVVPSKIRFMVQLYKFIESEDSIFLIQEHATGGRLWHYVKSYLQHSPTHNIETSDLVIHTNQVPTYLSNVYSGKKLLLSSEEEKAESDLVDDRQCVSSYARLFTTYAQTLPAEETVGLAKCRLQREKEEEEEEENRILQDLSKTLKKNTRIQRSMSRLSCDQVFMNSPPKQLSSSTGSLPPISRPRFRHFSAVFQQLDSQFSCNTCLPESCVRVWAAEIVVAVWQLHNLGIICRDLCPDNILLGSRGHILLSYFSQWDCVERILRMESFDNLYAAPELFGIDQVTPACDWWSVGALLFELITGRTLISCHPGGITSHTHLNIPNHISSESKSLLLEFLRYVPNERLGAGSNGIEAIKAHSFFHGLDWNQIINDPIN